MALQTNGGTTIGDLMSSGLAVSTDVIDAEGVELVVRPDGRVWLNVDGVCVFRCKSAKTVKLDRADGVKITRGGWIK